MHDPRYDDSPFARMPDSLQKIQYAAAEIAHADHNQRRWGSLGELGCSPTIALQLRYVATIQP
jgi:hypothetical protein